MSDLIRALRAKDDTLSSMAADELEKQERLLHKMSSPLQEAKHNYENNYRADGALKVRTYEALQAFLEWKDGK